ncbi:MFS transporter [Rhizobium sp. KVB221]|uniref:MFS transporter n=1 Tax=Rhizobium setariae TaxID=2801340 RepID=A0A937CP03_9HYPH|nr:MFS transporter [Rhizobium setariae]MBL0371843.1 MFS transporter [Rhizobium setariae]
MSDTSPSHFAHPGQFSRRISIAYGVVAAALFSASSSAPTPVYHLYQETLGLTPVMLMTIFSVYAFTLLAALLTIGSLSDYVGRKPVIFGALGLNLIAMALFAEAASAGMLVLARAIQGLAAGAAMTTMGAAILDFDRARGPVINSLTAFIGLTAGSLVSGVLVTYAPLPTQLVYVVLLAATLLLIVLLRWLPESTEGKKGAWASLKPHIAVPAQTRKALLRITPVNIAGWALGGFYFSLMPSLIRVATGITAPVFGGVIVAILTLTATFTALVLKSRPGTQVLTIGTLSLISGVAVTLAGVYLHLVPLMLLGAVVTGVGFGSCYSGALRIVLPLAHPDERAGLLSTFFIQSYLAFSLPTIAVGLIAPSIGLSNAAYLYGGIVILLAAISLAATRAPRREPSAA